jgi:hypothetical protein
MKVNEVAKSQQQMKYIYAMRDKYGTKKNAPKNMKWVFDEEWVSGIKMKNLPKKIKKNESHIMSFGAFVNESYEFEDFTMMNDMEYVKELLNDDEEMDLLYCKRCGEYIGGISSNNLCVGCQPKVEMDLLYCKKCGEYIGGISPNNLCVGCQPKVKDY